MPDRLSYDGYFLRWHGSPTEEYEAFTGPADHSLKESVKGLGPTVQGLYTVNPPDIKKVDPDKQHIWGDRRILLEPYAATVKRMKDCFLLRNEMYIHGGEDDKTLGCIQIKSKTDHKKFFDRLESYKKKIDLEVKYVSEREEQYEEKKCPY